MPVLLHACCGPCLPGPLERLRSEGHQVWGFFYNPNIHPLIEFRRRVKAVKVFQEQDPIEVDFCEEYGLEEFLEQVYGAPGPRCARCYELRLRRTALRAKELNADSFTSTMLQSKHQDHELVSDIGHRVGEEVGVQFLYEDFRPFADRSAEVSRRRMLYHQNYCGCIFSEYERFKDTSRQLYRRR